MDLRLKCKDCRLLKAVAILSCIYLLGISAILRANFYYIDDMGRALLGYKNFDFFGRYIPQYFTTVLHADSYLTDVSPLPQLLAVVILAMAAVTVLHVVTGRSEFTFAEYASTIPLCLSPYFLECLSYKYDSPYMALSILASVAPVLFYKRGELWYCVSILLGMLIVCTSYQPAAGIFPMFVILIAFLKWMDNVPWKPIVRFVLVSAGGFIAGMLLFAVFLLNPQETYVSNTLPAVSEMIPTTVRHLKHYYYYVVHDFKLEWLILTGIIFAGFILTSVRVSLQSKWLTFLLGSGVLLAWLCLSFGIYPVLSDPLYDPRAMYGFGACICFAAIPFMTRPRMFVLKAACIILSWCFFVFGFTYGNALAVQKDYTDYRIAAVVHDLDELDVMETGDSKVCQLEGDIGFAPEISHMPQDYEMLNRLVPNTFGYSSSYWRGFRFFMYYGLKNLDWDTDYDLTEYDLPVLKNSIYHTIYGNDEYILIELRPY